MSLYPVKMELPPNISVFKKGKLRLIEWASNNDKYGLIYMNERLFSLIKWIVIPLAFFLLAQVFPQLTNGGAILYYAMVITWSHFVSVALVKTRPDKWLKAGSDPREMEIAEIVQINHDTYLYEMKLDHSNQELGFTTMQHFTVHVPIEELAEPSTRGEWNAREEDRSKGGNIVRKYTPLTHDKPIGKVIFFVKVYDKCEHYEDGGRFGRWIKDKKVGDTLNVSGPVGHYEYAPGGGFKSSIKKQTWWNIKHVNYVCGGSGVAPAIQLMNAIFYDTLPNDIEFNLIFANKKTDDLIFESVLEDFQLAFPQRIRIRYTVDALKEEEASDWTHSVGYITEEMFEKFLAPTGDSTLFFLCGPRPMREMGLKFAEDMGQPRELIWGI